jgi:hypothetical protein
MLRAAAATVVLLAGASLTGCDGCAGVVAGEGEGEGDAGEGEGEGEGDEGEGDEGEGEGEPSLGKIVASPAPGVYGAAVDVTFTVVDPALPLHVWLTTDGTVPVAGQGTAIEVTGPVTIDHSVAVRAVGADDQGITRVGFFGAWLLADADTASFTSNLPVLVFWSLDAVPDDKTVDYASSSLLVFDSHASGVAGERVQWPQAATSSLRAGIKIHGSSTAGYPKHPWRVETRQPLSDDDQKTALLGMPEDGDWILGAPLDFDRALMRTTLAYAVSRAIGRYAPRTQFAEVYLVGDGAAVSSADYVGIYEVTEHVERGADRVDIAKLQGADVTGGYIFKEDREGPGDVAFRAGDGGGAFDFQQPFVHVEPKDSDLLASQRDYLQSDLDDVGLALASPDFTSPVSGLHYSELIDVDSFIDHHIVNIFTKNPDAFRLSGFFHKDRDGLVEAGPVWDFDRTMGCASDGRAGDPTHWDATNETSDTTPAFDHGWYRGLFRDPAFTAQYWARFGEVLDDVLNPAVLDPIIEQQAALLDEAQARNFARWSDYPPRGTYADEVALLEDWLAQRHDWIAACLTLPDPSTCE